MIKRQYFVGILFGLLLFATLLAQAASLKLTNVQVITQDNNSRILLNLNNNSAYHVFTLAHPDRLVIDFPAAQLATSLRGLVLTNTLFARVREGHPNPNTLRIVFDLNQPLASNTLHVSRSPTNNGEQLILEISSNVNKTTVVGQTTAQQLPDNSNQHPNQQALQNTQQWTQENLPNTKTTLTTNQTNAINKTTAIKQNNPVGQATAKQLPDNSVTHANQQINPTPVIARSIVVVIDPGHGGKDPGTKGPMGIREKDVVLAISRDLYQLLRKEPGYHAALTRTGDYFIPLRGRLAIARQDKGDMFIAIHADAYNEPGATGAAVFALSQHGASSEAARWLAEKENYSELGDVTLSDKSDMLRSVLIDLSQTATISSSMQLGSSLLPQLARVGRLHYTHVEQAPFMVLKSPDIPSLLIETGFLSNPIEERRLSDRVYQQKIAQAIFIGIKNYFWNNPPPDTIIAALKQNKKLS